MSDASRFIELLARRQQTCAVAESLTGGLLASMLVDVPGASRCFRGGLVVYATDLKATLALVPSELLAQRGPVDPEVAVALAEGARRQCGADWAIATTGVAGPDSQHGHRVGEAYVAVVGPDSNIVQRILVPGERNTVRQAVALKALAYAIDAVV